MLVNMMITQLREFGLIAVNSFDSQTKGTADKGKNKENVIFFQNFVYVSGFGF